MVRYLSDDLKILPFNRLFIVGVLGYRFMISGLKTELLVQAVPWKMNQLILIDVVFTYLYWEKNSRKI